MVHEDSGKIILIAGGAAGAWMMHDSTNARMDKCGNSSTAFRFKNTAEGLCGKHSLDNHKVYFFNFGAGYYSEGQFYLLH